MDLAMLEFHNGQERYSNDWVELFHTASSSFRVVSIKQPKSSQLGIVEAVWEGT